VDLQQYIASGILEAYALGALSPAEARAVEADVAKYPELQAELRSIEEALWESTRAEAPQPSAGTADAIWAAIQADGAVRNSPAEAAPRKPLEIPLGKTPARRPVQWARAAVWVALVVSVAGNAYQMTRTARMEDRLTTLYDAQNRIEAEAKDRTQEVIALRELTADTGTIRLTLKPTTPHVHGSAVVMYQPHSSAAYFAFSGGMPAAPAGKQYQLWIIHDGKPVDMGLVPRESGSGDMLRAPKAVPGTPQAFAISLEPVGGSTSPTTDQILMVGAMPS